MPRITEMIGGEPYVYSPLGEYVVKAQGVCGGRPTFKYTRIPVSGAINRLEAGEDIDAIIESYRNKVSKAAILEALELSRETGTKSKPLKRAAA